MTSFDDTDAFEAASLSARAMAARPQPYLDGLNPAQRAAVEQMDGPVLMLAGAGTGKTAALTARLAYLVHKRRAWPSEILCVTFTNKAAREMKDRIAKVIGPAEAKNVWMGTFHSIFARILRVEGERLGFPSNFTIYDSEDAQKVLANVIKELNLDKLLKFLKLSNYHRSTKHSFVFVNDAINIDDIPEEIIVVPTLEEAGDIVEMEEIERDLGF